MKKICAVLAVALMAAAPVWAQEEDGWSFGGDVALATSYTWRGYTSGGLSIQPEVFADWTKGDFCLELGAWYNKSFQDEPFGTFTMGGYSEMDFYAEASYKWVAVSAYDYCCDDFFGSYADNHALDVTLTVGGTDEIPLSLAWSTIVAGCDTKMVGLEQKRAFSSYAEAAYAFAFPDVPVDFTLSAGLVPWGSPYIEAPGDWDYVTELTKPHLTNVGLQGEHAFELGGLSLPVRASVGFNPAINQMLWCVGCSIEF